MHNAFPSIEAFDRLAAFQAYVREKSPEAYRPQVSLRGKIKLHGMNTAFGAGPDGIWAQSREHILTPALDPGGARTTLLGFADRFAQENASLIDMEGFTFTVFGEWAGTGVQKKDAITQIGRKMFFPFLVSFHGPGFTARPEDRRAERRQILVDTAPERIREWIGFEDPSLFVMPWDGDAVTFDFADPERLEAAVEAINARSEAVGLSDPFVRDLFGVEGPGEGLVYVPDTTSGPITLDTYANLTFKAKAARHRVKISDKAAKIATELPKDAHDFVETFVTENRMEQMLAEKLSGDTDKTRTGDFVAAVIKDVFKESVPERAALDVTDKALSGLISRKAAKWFMARSTVRFDPDIA